MIVKEALLMKTAIIYHSSHHGNTKKLLDAIAKAHDVTLINATEDLTADLSGYGMVGFASGIYYGKFHKSVLKAAEKLPKEKKGPSFSTPMAPRKKAIQMQSAKQ